MIRVPFVRGCWMLFFVLMLSVVAIAEDSFSVVLLPDTQNYSEKYPDTYVHQAMWIRENAQKENTKFVVHLGDIVQTAEIEKEWVNADRAMSMLDGSVPYSMVPGNHDQNKNKGKLTRETTLYNKYFGPQRYENETWYGGHFEDDNDNNYCTFEAAGMKFMVISLEFAPRDEVLAWAGEVASSHPEHRVIVATHCYMNPDGRNNSVAKQYHLEGNDGEGMWQKLVRKQPNIFLVVSGHVLGTGIQTSTNDAGKPVHEMLVDYQGLPNGGDGWLRSLKFFPKENRIQVISYSPLLNQYKSGEKEAFDLTYSMTEAAK